MSTSNQDQWMNGRGLAKAMFGGSDDSSRGEWVVYGIKKANRILHAQGREPLIFTGQLSTPAKISKWLEEHPDFVANQVLTSRSSSSPERPTQPVSRTLTGTGGVLVEAPVVRRPRIRREHEVPPAPGYEYAGATNGASGPAKRRRY